MDWIKLEKHATESMKHYGSMFVTWAATLVLPVNVLNPFFILVRISALTKIRDLDL